jgi:hypothetical protein
MKTFVAFIVSLIIGFGVGCGIDSAWKIKALEGELAVLQYDYYKGKQDGR